MIEFLFYALGTWKLIEIFVWCIKSLEDQAAK